mmetsp:Transcript_44103/g.104359  ORF Transcript_44103/g.104359 Transcript_44103/m.104359 type:complete len:416 (+) Transcript_44103:66-1313(+)|eukprot:CAMPEP_0178383404 /NCGR_PEP_ID=MMETSP0689_2-20121128/6984_1 /TAXON_ID=160604 /ORGANISM="Amphidinium massartii, Strain CS-259" /LENGTH=415 /DNA_ID=CAMNT_0020003623 /DNA_START=24 /DNA_END=1271 /DNA_ORIENTATION=-
MAGEGLLPMDNIQMRKRLSVKSERRYFVAQAVVCVLCTLVGAFYPTLLDWSKTAIERTAYADRVLDRRAYPFSSVSVVLVNDIVQLSLALLVLGKKEGFSGVASNRGLLLKTLPLGAIYAIGELLTLRSVQKGSGPVYVVIANMKLVVAACMSRAVFGRAWTLPWLHWLELILISFAAALYTLAEAGSLGSQWAWEGAWMALAKSSLVAFSSVFCEHTYKTNSFLIVVTLQAAWGLATIVTLIAVSWSGLAMGGVALELSGSDGAFSLFGGGPKHPLCSSEAHSACLRSLGRAADASCTCISARGWDGYTLLAVLADLSNAISTALIFKRLSAVAKYICRAASAVPMYLFYCIVGRSKWDLRVFAIVVYLCAQVAFYTVQRHRVAEDVQKASWVPTYSKSTSKETTTSSTSGKRE